MNIIIIKKITWLYTAKQQNNIFFTCSTLFYISLPSLNVNGYFHSVWPVERLVRLGITNYTVQAFIYQPCHDIAVTLYITVTGQCNFPKIFSCHISSEKLTCIYVYYIDTSVLLENIPLVKLIKTTSGTRVVYFP